MAATWLKPLHVNKGKSIAQTITDRTDYAENPDKTERGTLVKGYGCDPRTVDAVCCKGCFRITPLSQHGGHIIRSSLGRHSRKKVDT